MKARLGPFRRLLESVGLLLALLLPCLHAVELALGSHGPVGFPRRSQDIRLARERHFVHLRLFQGFPVVESHLAVIRINVLGHRSATA